MSEEDSSVERLKKSLYVRNKEPKLKERHELHDMAHEDVQSSWVDEEEVKEQQEILHNGERYLEELHKGHVYTGKQEDLIRLRDERFKEEARKRRYEEGEASDRMIPRFIKVVFIASLVFFVFAAGLAGYFLFGGKNQVSCDNVAIALSGPRTIASGKKLTLDVTVKNNNPVPMLSTNVQMVYPEGTKNAERSSDSLSTTNELIGTVNVGEQVRTTARATLFGQEQSEAKIKSIITYTIDDSNASFSCESEYSVVIATAPVSLTVQGLEEISSGQEINLEVAVTSNSDEVVPNLRLVVEYPYGFEFIKSEPEPSIEKNVWDIGDVPSGTERIVRINGIMKGQGTESRAISLSVGDKSDVSNRELKTILQKIEHQLVVTRPFLELSLKLNDEDKPQKVATLGETINGVIHWKNTLPNALYGVEVEAVLDGIMLDPSSVSAGNGFFRSIDKTILWAPQMHKEFEKVEPGQEGELDFQFSTKEIGGGTSISNPTMNIDVDVRARRVSENVQVPQSLVNQAKKTILFDSEIVFDAYGLYGVGPFKNTGPHPPRVDLETTYTVALVLKNNINDVENIEVRGVLPINVTWLGVTDPKEERITYNPVTREVIWSVGTVGRGVGYQSGERIAYFQVSTIPSVSQLHSEVRLIDAVKMQGIDAFTKNVLQRDIIWVETTLKNDPYFKNVWGAVQD